jgi:excisionase family DNA binding protein
VKHPHCLPKRALTKGQAAITLGVSEPTLVKLVREKRLRAVWVTETSLRILPEDLDTFIAENATCPARGDAHVLVGLRAP